MIYGIDLINDTLQLAGSDNSSGRVVIGFLSQISLDDIKPDIFSSSGELRFSVPEDLAIIKNIKIPSGKNLDKEELAEFEFMSTLIDNKKELYISTSAVNGGSVYLVFGCHKNIIDKKNKFFEDNFFKPSGYKLRGLALADGYLNYCWREGGELICLLDLSPQSISYCFINKNQPIFVGSIINSDPDSTYNNSISASFLSDIKATLQFQTSNLFRSGFSTPLSMIVISGTLAGKTSNDIFEDKLQVRTISPTIKTALFAPEVADRAGQFLVSLGLTVSN